MRKFWLAVIFLLGIGMTPPWAQSSQRHSDMKVLEASLGGLKESYQAVADRNDRLLSDIAVYAQNIELLRQELTRLNETKTGLLEGRLSVESAYPSGEDEASLRTEIDRLSRDLDPLSQDRIEKAFLSKQSALISSIERNQEDIKSKEADLNKINRQYEKPLKRVDSLKAEQIRLKLKVAGLQDRLKKSLGESGNIGPLPSRNDNKNEARLSQLNSDIVRLRLYQQKLIQDVLKNVQGVSPGDVDHEGALWERRLNALKEENAVLKEEITAIRGF